MITAVEVIGKLNQNKKNSPEEILVKEVGLSNLELKVLIHQHLQSGVKQKEIAAELNTTPQTVCKSIKKLKTYQLPEIKEYAIEITDEWLDSSLSCYHLAVLQYLEYLTPQINIDRDWQKLLNQYAGTQYYESLKNKALIFTKGVAQDGVYQSTLAKIFNVTQQSISKVLLTLEKEGYIKSQAQYNILDNRASRTKNSYEILKPLKRTQELINTSYQPNYQRVCEFEFNAPSQKEALTVVEENPNYIIEDYYSEETKRNVVDNKWGIKFDLNDFPVAIIPDYLKYDWELRQFLKENRLTVVFSSTQSPTEELVTDLR